MRRKPSGGGIGERFEKKHIKPPKVRITSLPPKLIRAIIYEINKLKIMGRFELILSGESGLEFTGSRTGKGALCRGRRPEMMILHFKVKFPRVSPDDCVLHPDTENEIDELYMGIQSLDIIKENKLVLKDGSHFIRYNVESKNEPDEFLIALEWRPKIQIEHEVYMEKQELDTWTGRIKNKLLSSPGVESFITRIIDQAKRMGIL